MEVNLITYFSLLLCTLGGLQGFVLAAALFKISKKRNGSYRWLIALVLSVSATLLGRSLFSFEEFIDVRLTLFTDLVLFVYGPLYYFFIKSSFQEHADSSSFYKHLIPSLVHVAILIPQFLMSKNEYLLFTDTRFWIIYVIVLVTFAFIHNSYYWWKSKLFIRSQLQSLGSQNIDHIAIPHKMYGVLILLFAISIALFIPYYIVAINLYQLTWVFASWLTYGITYYLIFHPDSFGDSIIKVKRNKRRFQHEPRKLKEIALNLKEELDNHKVHLNPEISLAKLSETLSTNSVLLSKAINQEFKCSFYDLLNRYRVEEFIRLAHDKKNDHLNYLGLATQAGFNSKTTFNKYFKKYKGTTPKHYFALEKLS
ncbi:MAG: AraC family transcriptional regulator [Bacteroidota bacterium]